MRKRFLSPRSLARTGLACAALPVIGVWLTGRFGQGQPEALCSPWAFQLALGLSALAIAALLLRWRPAFILISACALWAWAVIGPVAIRDSFAPRSAHAGTVSDQDAFASLRLLHANLLVYRAPRPEAVAWILAHDADVILLQELSHDWSAALHSLRDSHPHRIWHPTNRPDGVGLASRLPILASEFLPAGHGHFGVIDLLIETPAGPVRLLCTHPWSPTSRRSVAGRNEHFEALIERFESDPFGVAPDAPTVILGDLNETPWGKMMARLLQRTGLRSAREGFGRLPTWPDTWPPTGRRVPAVVRIPIDHCLVDPRIRVEGFALGPSIGSDHRPITADLLIPRAARAE